MTDNDDKTIENAHAGDAHAQWLLGCAYWYGEEEIGIAQDKLEAMRWFEKAANQAHEDAIRSLYQHAREMEKKIWRLGKYATDDMRAIASYGDVAVALANDFEIDLTFEGGQEENHDAPQP